MRKIRDGKKNSEDTAEGNLRIDEELSLFTDVRGRRLMPKGNMTLKKQCGDELVQDEFDHEQYLVIETEGKSVLMSGCAHNGIVNILDEYKRIYGGEPTHVISGFHTMKKEYTKEDDEIISKTADCLKEMKTRFYSGHCTGEYPLEIMKGIMGESLVVIHSGDDIMTS